MGRIPSFLALGLALAVAPAALADDPATEVAARAAARGIAADPLVEPIREAERRGLPVRPVVDKVLEGIAKGVAPERIADVAAAVVVRLGEADDLLESARARGLTAPTDRPAALVDLAQALGAGVDRSSVEALVAAAKGRSRRAADVVAAATALGALVRRGVPVADAVPLGRALVGSPRRAPEVGPAFDVWRAHGGRDLAEFLSETERRVATGRSFAEFDRDAHGGGGREAATEGRGAMGGEGHRGRRP